LSIQFVLKLAACLALAGTLTLCCKAQQTTPPQSSDSPTANQPQPAQTQPSQDASKPPAAPPAAPDKDSGKDKDKSGQDASGQGKVAGTSNDRLFYALPNFLSLENGKQLPPLTAKDKFKVVALGTFDYIQYPWWGLISAIGQAANSEPAYGQGWVGYAKRYGTTAGDSTVENFMVGAVFPSILHQDPRFYYSEKGGWKRRTGYAISRIFVTRTDSGKTQFNYSEIFGAATAATISTYSYHPKSTVINGKFIGSDRTVSNTIDVFGTQLALDTATIVIKEFWPDIHRKMSHKHKGDAAAAPSANPSNL
jgi:hypothetical protein